MSLFLIWLAFVVDWLVGDPPNWPHPIRWIGSSISRMEKGLRRLGEKPQWLKIAGALLWVVTVGGSYIVVESVLVASYHWHWTIGRVIELWLTVTVLAGKCLKDCALAVMKPLKQQDIGESRIQLSYIVGRDTSQLEAPQITRATVETVAENTIDGVIAPLFYLFIGGVPLAMAYKAVNTLDSMVGYKNERYQDLGWFSAKADDLFNWIPARLGWLLFTFAAWCLRLDWQSALHIGWRDRRQHKSPNAAWSEATVAGALGIQLGGPNRYFGQWVEKPWLGDKKREITPNDIVLTNRMMFIASSAALVLFTVIYFMIH